MEQRINISSGTEWEDQVGYSRAVKIGKWVEVTGTVASENGEVVGRDDPYIQTIKILEIIREVLKQAGAELRHVVRTRIYVTDISQWKEIGKAHRKFFEDIRPATTMVEVKALISPEYLVEIEARAFIND